MFSKENLRCHGISIQNTFFIVVFTILPFWFGILSTMLFAELVSLEPFYSRGDFFLYTISLISSAYISYYTASSSKKLLEGWLSIFSFILLVLVSGCYAFIISNNLTPRIEIVRVLSFSAFSLTIPLFYYSQFMVTKRSPDIVNYRNNEQVIIQNKLS